MAEILHDVRALTYSKGYKHDHVFSFASTRCRRVGCLRNKRLNAARFSHGV